MTLAAGRTFAGRFSVKRLLGEGGMGVVYEVTDAKFDGVRCALKALRDGRERDPRARELFAREVTAAASIQSDHVVKVTDYDLDGPIPWMVMELLEGDTLDAVVAERGPLPWRDARRLVTELGHALGEAHRVGVLHLDLKPSNLFLARLSDAYGTTRLKVLDFGLSRRLGEGHTHALQSQAMGTQAWMPPEQFAKGARLRPCADVWSFGLVVFWVLTGRHYWLSIDDRGEVENVMELMGELIQGAQVPASERALARGVATALPEGFDAWFSRCVAKDPVARWPDAAAASRALDEVLTGLSRTLPIQLVTLAPKAPHLGARARWSLRGGWFAAGLVGAGVLAVGGLALSSAGRVPGVERTTRGALEPSCPADMVLLPAGAFTMGSPDGVGGHDEHPAHRVELREPFCLERTEVSVRAYQACVLAGACTLPDAYAHRLGSPRGFCNWERPGGQEHPINCVDWSQARAYCAWPGHPGGARRLPTEAEWEYAAKGREGRPYPWGPEAPDGTRANLCGEECVQLARAWRFPDWLPLRGWLDAFGRTAPVGSLPLGATPEGVLDLVGNVWEWVDDAYDPEAYARHDEGGALPARAEGGASPLAPRVARGGSWYDYDLAWGRSAMRYWFVASFRTFYLGLRCARGAR